VKAGIIDRELACDIWGYVTLRQWNFLSDWITNLRRVRNNPGLYENFEYFAVLAKRSREKYANGRYPRDLERMPPGNVWKEIAVENEPVS